MSNASNIKVRISNSSVSVTAAAVTLTTGQIAAGLSSPKGLVLVANQASVVTLPTTANLITMLKRLTGRNTLDATELFYLDVNVVDSASSTAARQMTLTAGDGSTVFDDGGTLVLGASLSTMSARLVLHVYNGSTIHIRSLRTQAF